MRSREEIKAELEDLAIEGHNISVELSLANADDDVEELLARLHLVQRKYSDLMSELSVVANPDAELIACQTKEDHFSQPAEFIRNDNKLGNCASCNVEIVYRPYVPDSMTKVCLKCLGEIMQETRH